MLPACESDEMNFLSGVYQIPQILPYPSYLCRSTCGQGVAIRVNSGLEHLIEHLIFCFNYGFTKIFVFSRILSLMLVGLVLKTKTIFIGNSFSFNGGRLVM